MYGKNALAKCSRAAQRAALLSLFLWLFPVGAIAEVYPVPQNTQHASAGNHFKRERACQEQGALGVNAPNFPEQKCPRTTDVSPWYGVYQWTDSRGVIHFTDNLQSVPAAMRGSPDLIIRTDIKNDSFETPAVPPSITEEPAPEPQAPRAARSSEPEQETVIPQVVHINPQYFNIIVNNTKTHRHPDNKKRCLIPEGCQATFQPRINDRRYIHPSVFNGGSRQYIRPELFPKR